MTAAVCRNLYRPPWPGARVVARRALTIRRRKDALGTIIQMHLGLLSIIHPKASTTDRILLGFGIVMNEESIRTTMLFVIDVHVGDSALGFSMLC